MNAHQYAVHPSDPRVGRVLTFRGPGRIPQARPALPNIDVRRWPGIPPGANDVDFDESTTPDPDELYRDLGGGD